MRHLDAAVFSAALLLSPRLGAAEGTTLTLDDVLARAAARAPAIVAAQASIAEARGRLVGASALLRDNPQVFGGAGVRMQPTRDLLEARAGVSQTFEIGGRRQARIDGAEAAVTAEVAEADDARRQVLRLSAIAFFEALRASELQQLARDAATLAGETHRVAERRHRAGDVALLDLNLAAAALSRARSAEEAAAADYEAALGRLRVVLGLDASELVGVRGDLRERRGRLLPELLEHATERPDLQALAAEVERARADARLGRGLEWPEVGIGAEYERDEGDNVAMGTLSVSLPLFDRGQGVRAEALAREQRVQATLDAGRRRVDVEVRNGFEVVRRREEAVAEMERGALPGLAQNAALAQRSYEVGEMSLVDLLTVRGLILETRREYLDRLLEAAVAGVELEASAGVLR